MFLNWAFIAINILSKVSPVESEIFGFILFSVIGRGARFFLIAFLIYFGGENIKNMIEKYINRIGWFIIFIIFMIFLYFWKFS